MITKKSFAAVEIFLVKKMLWYYSVLAKNCFLNMGKMIAAAGINESDIFLYLLLPKNSLQLAQKLTEMLFSITVAHRHRSCELLVFTNEMKFGRLNSDHVLSGQKNLGMALSLNQFYWFQSRSL